VKPIRISLAFQLQSSGLLEGFMTVRMIAVALFAAAAALRAQAPTPQTTATTQEITVTGCVERADEVAGSTTAAATVDSLTFMLIHAQKGTAAESRPTATTGTSANAASSSYRLDADVSTLNPHVGHKVEVIGTLEPPAAPSASNTDATSPANAPRLKVDHVKMVSETCAR
jgi:hypothetical protein